jgi:hypothetical protein
MGADQRESVFVTADALQSDLPPSHGVASLAIRSELPPVDIRVAICALGTHICEHKAHMALLAGDSLMKAPQGIRGFVVIKFDNVAEGFPSRKGMTILTRSFQIAVGAACSGQLGSCLCLRRNRGEREK